VRPWQGPRPRAVLFDLDGTLIDTAEDIALALNRTLAAPGVAPVPLATVRGLIGRGAAALIARALQSRGQCADEARVGELFAQFIRQYARLLERGESRALPYPGAGEALRALAVAGVRLAVVTNKARQLALDTLTRAGLGAELQLVVGGDSCARRKPDPEPLLYACGQLGVAATAALMVGDSVNDVLAARAAGMPVLCVPYGYNEGVDPRTLACDGFVENLTELPKLLQA